MPLRMLEENGFTRVAAICDHCGQVIENAADGNYKWGEKGGEGSDIYFTHKRCSLQFDRSRPQDASYFENLDRLPVFLVNSLKIDWEAAKQNVARDAALG